MEEGFQELKVIQIAHKIIRVIPVVNQINCEQIKNTIFQIVWINLKVVHKYKWLVMFNILS